MLEVIKIDSLQIRIPKYNVTYIDPTFAKQYIRVYPDENGDLKLTDGELNQDKHKVSVIDGIKTRIAEVHVMNGKFSEKQIIIQVNAKMLKNKYLDGINFLNVRIVYDYLINLKIVYFSFKSFLQGHVSDIDYCYDVKVTPETMILGNKEIYDNIKPSCHQYVSKPFALKTNVGINLNTRENASPTRPHIKIYHKTLELLYNDKGSSEFAQKHLKDVDYKDIGRLEYTIKNRAHRKKLEINCNTLEDYLNLPQDLLGRIIFSGIFLYIEKSNFNKVLEDLRGKDKLIYALIKRCEEHGDKIEEIYKLLNIYNSRTKKNRAKNQLEKILTRVTKNLKIKPDYETSKFLEAIKVNFWSRGTEH